MGKGAKEAQASSEHIAKAPERLSRLTKDSTYRRKKQEGFTNGDWQSHHVACEHAVAGRDMSDQFLEDCLWITDWDINAPDNLMGLPINSQYRKSNGTVPVNLPSHQVDHNTSDGYTNECKQWLKDNVWDTLVDKSKTHEVNAEDIQAQLEDCSSTFKTKLNKRGNRGGKGYKGTLLCWQNRHEESMKDAWYKPFSMAKYPRRRHPGVKASIWSKMTDIFKQIK